MLRSNMWVEATSSLLLYLKLFCCLVLIVYVVLNPKFTLPMLVWLSREVIHFLFMNSEINIYSTSWSTQVLITVYLKQRPPSSPPFCMEIKFRLFATAVVSHTLHYSLTFKGTSPLPKFLWGFIYFRGLLVSHKCQRRCS